MNCFRAETVMVSLEFTVFRRKQFWSDWKLLFSSRNSLGQSYQNCFHAKTVVVRMENTVSGRKQFWSEWNLLFSRGNSKFQRDFYYVRRRKETSVLITPPIIDNEKVFFVNGNELE